MHIKLVPEIEKINMYKYEELMILKENVDFDVLSANGTLAPVKEAATLWSLI